MHTGSTRESGSIDLVTANEPACGSTSRMTGNAASALALLTVQTHGEHALRLDWEGNLIAGNDLTLGYREAGLAANGDGC